jgi:protein phosphatase
MQPVNGAQAVRTVLSAYKELFALDSPQLDGLGITFPIPTFDLDVILAVCQAARKNFERNDILLHLKSPLYVVGDIHGNIFDLVRILIHVIPPPQSKILFLGDYVDRGEYSIEVMTLLFALSVAYPDNIILLRGNHEFESANSVYGFASEVNALYPGTDLFTAMNAVFAFMPLVAVIDNEIFCVHGGIAPSLTNLSRLRRIKRPLMNYDSQIVSHLLWSDPCWESETPSGSIRGHGIQFGPKALHDFLSTLRLSKMLRAHECVPTGIARFAGEQLYTVFSSSGYEGQSNRCGLIFVKGGTEMEFFSLPPIEQVSRMSAVLKRCRDEPVEFGERDSIAVRLKKRDSELSTKSFSFRSVPQQPSLLQKTGRRLSAVLTRIGPATGLLPTRSSSVDSVAALGEGVAS